MGNHLAIRSLSAENRLINIYENVLMKTGKKTARRLYQEYFSKSHSMDKIDKLEATIDAKINKEKRKDINEFIIWSQNGKYSNEKSERPIRIPNKLQF